MGALADKRAAVVPIEVARRRLRPELGLAPRVQPPTPRSKALSVLLAGAALTVMALAVLGLRFAFDYVDKGNYWAAVMVPWMILLPAMVLMFLLLSTRQRPNVRIVPRRKPILKLTPRSQHRAQH